MNNKWTIRRWKFYYDSRMHIQKYKKKYNRGVPENRENRENGEYRENRILQYFEFTFIIRDSSLILNPSDRMIYNL